MTELERIVLKGFIQEGIRCTGATSIDSMISDNMTWMDPDDIVFITNLKEKQIGGVLRSLREKGLIENYGEPLPGCQKDVWYATDKGIEVGWNLI